MASTQFHDSNELGSPCPPIIETYPEPQALCPPIIETRVELTALCASLYGVAKKGYPHLQKEIGKLRRRFDDAEPVLNDVATDPEMGGHPAIIFLLSHLSKLYRHCYPEYGLARLFGKPWHRYNPPDPNFKLPVMPPSDRMLATLLEALINPPPVKPSPQSTKPTGFRVRTFAELQRLRSTRPKVELKAALRKRKARVDEEEEDSHEFHLFIPSDDDDDPMSAFKAQPSRLLLPFEQLSDNDNEGSDDETEHTEATQNRDIANPSRIRGIGNRISEYSGSEEDESIDPEEKFYEYQESYEKLAKLQGLASKQADDVEAARMNFLRAVAQRVKAWGITAVVPSIFSSEAELWALCDQNPHDRPICRGRSIQVQALGRDTGPHDGV